MYFYTDFVLVDIIRVMKITKLLTYLPLRVLRSAVQIKVTTITVNHT